MPRRLQKGVMYAFERIPYLLPICKCISVPSRAGMALVHLFTQGSRGPGCMIDETGNLCSGMHRVISQTNSMVPKSGAFLEFYKMPHLVTLRFDKRSYNKIVREHVLSTSYPG
jgi:hypothetical protein